LKPAHGLDAVLHSIHACEAHIRSEYVHDLAGTMATVSARPHYAVTAAPGVVSVISGREGVAALYEAAHHSAVPEASRFVSQIASDWYMFVENVPTRKWVPDGSLRTVHTATLLVTDGEGVKGEFVWERPSCETAPAAAQPALPLGPLRSVGLHERLLGAICEGDRDSLVSLLDPGCTWAERDYDDDVEGGAILELRGAAAAAEHLATWHARQRPERVVVVNRQATDWYVFAEELWILRPEDGSRRQCRKAVIYPVSPAGRVQGAIGFGADAEAPSAFSDIAIGQAFWPEPAVGEGGAPARTREPRPI
jgi:hypothetical protein